MLRAARLAANRRTVIVESCLERFRVVIEAESDERQAMDPDPIWEPYSPSREDCERILVSALRKLPEALS